MTNTDLLDFPENDSAANTFAINDLVNGDWVTSKWNNGGKVKLTNSRSKIKTVSEIAQDTSKTHTSFGHIKIFEKMNKTIDLSTVD